MQELGLDPGQVSLWFTVVQESPYVLARIDATTIAHWSDDAVIGIRRCYVKDETVVERAVLLGCSKADVLRAVLPDPGSTMAGDFGEILAYIFLAGRENPQTIVGPKKWRLKQDRTKPAPYSDVVQFVLPQWPAFTEADALLCAEVKVKSTAGSESQVKKAIADCAKDRVGRLAQTLAWLRERAIIGDLGDITIDHLNRFINAIEHPPYEKRFHAVAVVCSSLVASEMAEAPAEPSADYQLVILAVPQLHEVYNRLLQRVAVSLDQTAPIPVCEGP